MYSFVIGIKEYSVYSADNTFGNSIYAENINNPLIVYVLVRMPRTCILYVKVQSILFC